MPRLWLPRLRFSLRALWAVVTLAAVASAGVIHWRDVGQDFARQQAYCDELVHTLGGDHTLWIDREVGVFCGSYSRPDGLEFVHEERSRSWATLYRSDLREITSVSVSYATWNELPDSPVRAAVFGRLARLHTLRRLSIDIEKLSASDLLPLVELPNVEAVTLRGLDLGSADAALAVLGRMSRLHELEIEFSVDAIGAINSPEQLELLASRAATSAGGSPNESAVKNATADDEGADELPSDNSDGGLYDTDRIPVVGLSAQGFAHLGRLRDLQKMHLGNAVILDGGLGALDSITELGLFQCRFSRAGYAGLAGCRRLVELDISMSNLSDAAAAAIGALPQLRKLSLFDGVTDRQLAAICGQHGIEELSLWNVRELSQDGLKPLRTLPIRRLFISIGKNANPEMLEELSTVPALRELEISAHDPTFAFLPNLADLNQLEVLRISGTELPPKRLAKLRHTFPNAKVSVGYTARIGNEPPAPDIEDDAESADVN